MGTPGEASPLLGKPLLGKPPPPPSAPEAANAEDELPPPTYTGVGVTEEGPLPAPPAFADDVGYWSGLKASPHFKCFMLTVGMAVCLGLFLGAGPEIGYSESQFYASFFGIYGIYLLECCCAHTARYLANMESGASMETFHAGLTRTAPAIEWSITCYHYETRTRVVTRSVPNGNGGTRTETHTETYTVRVDTHSARTTYGLRGWSDASPPPQHTSHELAKVKYAKHFEWRDTEAKLVHDAAFATWVAQNDRDVHKDVNWGFSLRGFVPYHIEVRDGAAVPCAMRNHALYVIMSLAGLSWFFRVWMGAQVGVRHESIRKVGW